MKTLSDKIISHNPNKDDRLIYVKDVKEFIKELKKGINNGLRAGKLIRKDIDELAGEKLIWTH